MIATNLKIEARPYQGPSAVTRYRFNRNAATLLAIDGEEVGFPAGCMNLEICPRLCGDFYAEVKGVRFHVSACADTPLNAVQAAIGRIPPERVAA